MPVITFKAPITKVGAATILHLPKVASAKLPSRGMVMVTGTINKFPFQTPFEPDGKGSHWLLVDSAMQEAIEANAGDTVSVVIQPSKEWPEPKIPADLQAALTANTAAENVWKDITAMARWDWIRWINATKNPDTRQRRITVTCSKLTDAKRRPCCFNRTMCTDPYMSKNGVLLEPTPHTV